MKIKLTDWQKGYIAGWLVGTIGSALGIIAGSFLK